MKTLKPIPLGAELNIKCQYQAEYKPYSKFPFFILNPLNKNRMTVEI